MLSTEILLHVWLSTEYNGFRPSSTAVDTVSLHVPHTASKTNANRILLATIVTEVSNIVSFLLMRLLLQRLTSEVVRHQNLLPFSF